MSLAPVADRHRGRSRMVPTSAVNCAADFVPVEVVLAPDSSASSALVYRLAHHGGDGVRAADRAACNLHLGGAS